MCVQGCLRTMLPNCVNLSSGFPPEFTVEVSAGTVKNILHCDPQHKQSGFLILADEPSQTYDFPLENTNAAYRIDTKICSIAQHQWVMC